MNNSELNTLALMVRSMNRTFFLLKIAMKAYRIIEIISEVLSLFITAHLTAAYLIMVTPIILSMAIIEAMVLCTGSVITDQGQWYERKRNFIYRKMQSITARRIYAVVQVNELRSERKLLNRINRNRRYHETRIEH